MKLVCHGLLVLLLAIAANARLYYVQYEQAEQQASLKSLAKFVEHLARS